MTPHDAFDRIVDSLNEAMLTEARWVEASALIDEACGARGSILLVAGEFPSADLEIHFSKCYHRGERRSEWQREYFRRYHHVDEHLPRLRKLPDGKIVQIADLFSEDERKTSPTYNEGLPRFETQNGLNVRLDGPCGSHIVWGIADPVDSSGWSSSRVDMAVRVLPHLRQYVRVRSALVEAGGLGASLTELLDNTRTGVIQLDRRGRIVETNDSAMEILRGDDGLCDEDRALRAALPEDDARLQDLLARALPRLGGQGESGSMVVRRTSSRASFALHVKPVANREVDYRSWRVAALVVIADPVSRARVEADVVEAVLGFTPTEAEIAVLLAEGRTLRQIAATTGRGYGTVRSHLKHMFVKVGCSRQFEVAQAVLALSSFPRPRD